MRKTSLLITLAVASMSASAVDVTSATTSVGTVTTKTQQIQKALPDRRDVAGAAIIENIIIPEPIITKPVITGLPDPVFELPVVVIHPETQ